MYTHPSKAGCHYPATKLDANSTSATVMRPLGGNKCIPNEQFHLGRVGKKWDCEGLMRQRVCVLNWMYNANILGSDIII